MKELRFNGLRVVGECWRILSEPAFSYSISTPAKEKLFASQEVRTINEPFKFDALMVRKKTYFFSLFHSVEIAVCNDIFN